MNIYCFSTLSFAKLQFKSVINKAFHKHGVASFTDAWIETLFIGMLKVMEKGRIFYRCVDWNQSPHSGTCGIKVASFTDAWIETTSERLTLASVSRRIFYRCVDWNVRLPNFGTPALSRIFYRCVDWNYIKVIGTFALGVASFTDAWIETRRRNEH